MCRKPHWGPHVTWAPKDSDRDVCLQWCVCLMQVMKWQSASAHLHKILLQLSELVTKLCLPTSVLLTSLDILRLDSIQLCQDTLQFFSVQTKQQTFMCARKTKLSRTFCHSQELKRQKSKANNEDSKKCWHLKKKKKREQTTVVRSGTNYSKFIDTKRGNKQRYVLGVCGCS